MAKTANEENTNGLIGNDDLITVTIGEQDLRFDVGTADFNQYINEQTPLNKVAPAHNFLQRTILKDDKEALKKIVMRNKAPNGAIVMQIAAVIAQEFGVDVEITVKKSNASLLA
ncbi:MAG: putative phage tail assembly chaperone [Methylobacter sp.]